MNDRLIPKKIFIQTVKDTSIFKSSEYTWKIYDDMVVVQSKDRRRKYYFPFRYIVECYEEYR